MDYFDYNY